MSRFFSHLICLMLPLLIVSSAFAVTGDVINEFATPGNHPTGLTFDGKNLWVADKLNDTLYALNPDNGEILKRLPTPGYSPSGLTWDGKYLWCSDLEEELIYRIDTQSGQIIKAIESPEPGIQGLAYDNKDLWIVSNRSDVLCKISIEDGTTIERFTAPYKTASGLTRWHYHYLVADRKQDRIYFVDPEHEGEVDISFDSPGPYPRGLATDGKRLWCVDYQDDKIYELELGFKDLYKQDDSHKLEMTLTHEFVNYGPGNVDEADIYIAIPRDLPNQKILDEIKFTPEPDEIVKDRWDQPFARFTIKNPDMAKRIRIQMDVKAELFAVRNFVFPKKVGKLEDIPNDIKERYLVDEDKYRINDARIQKAVKEAIGDETNPYWMMRNIHKYIRDRLHYELSGGWNVAPRVLERGNGSCSEYTFLFISMCRAAGIPARYVGAIVIRGDEASTDDVFHRWSQVYLPNYGWVHVDPQGGDDEIPGEVSESIGVLSNRFLITTEGGGSSEYIGWNYNYGHQWKGTGPIKVHAECYAEWSPLEIDTADPLESQGNACEVE